MMYKVVKPKDEYWRITVLYFKVHYIRAMATLGIIRTLKPWEQSLPTRWVDGMMHEIFILMDAYWRIIVSC